MERIRKDLGHINRNLDEIREELSEVFHSSRPQGHHLLHSLGAGVEPGDLKFKVLLIEYSRSF